MAPEVQPRQDPLYLLNALDLIEKHRVSVSPMMNPREISHSFSVEFQSQVDDGPPMTKVHGGPLVDGVVLVEHVSRQPIAKVNGEFEIQFQVVVVNDDLGELGVTTILRSLLIYVAQVIDYVLSQSLSIGSATAIS